MLYLKSVALRCSVVPRVGWSGMELNPHIHFQKPGTAKCCFEKVVLQMTQGTSGENVRAGDKIPRM